MTAADSWAARIRRYRPSRIGLRLLAFNLLLVFLPVAGILYLDVYEGRLLEVQERGMVQQGRLVAAALGDRAPIDAVAADALLGRLGQRSEARIRVYDAVGTLIADSARHVPAQVERPAYESKEYAPRSVRDRVLYRVGVWLVSVRRAVGAPVQWLLSFGRPTPSTGTRPADPISSSEAIAVVRAALEGRYDATYRPTPGQRSITLYSAVPIKDGDRVVGAALVSQSTLRILQALYDVRLRIFEIVVLSIGVAVVLGLVMSATIVRPLVRLRRAAVALSDRRATPASFRRVDRKDEIGDLARSLEELTGRLDAHIRLLESFAGDVSHEFKNPLASIRVAAEIIAGTDDPAERTRLLRLLTRDVDRLERLVSGVRELARIDALIAHEAMETVDLNALLEDLARGFGQREVPADIAVRASGEMAVRASADRLAQVFENVLDNAASFSPPGSRIEVTAGAEDEWCTVTVDDRGPGIPAAHLDRVFDRFFSFRPDDETPRDHMGLGLPIARAIIEGYGGAIQAKNRPGGGTRIEIRLRRGNRLQPNSGVAQIASSARSVSESK
jgi:two-component system, OmpR family, sensor histidine kinase ChvG